MRVSRRGHHWSASPVLRIAISTVGKGFSLQGNKATSISGPTALLWVTSPGTSTGTTEHHLQCLKLQYSFFTLLSTVWVPEVHHRLLVTPLWKLKFLGKQLHPSPASNEGGFVLDLQFFPMQAVTSLAGRVQPQKAQLLPVHQSWDASPRAAQELGLFPGLPAQPGCSVPVLFQDCSQGSLSSLAVLQLSLPSCSLPSTPLTVLP